MRIFLSLALVAYIGSAGANNKAVSYQKEPSCKDAVLHKPNLLAIEICKTELAQIHHSELSANQQGYQSASLSLELSKLYSQQGMGQLRKSLLKQVKQSSAFRHNADIRYRWHRQVGHHDLHQQQYSSAFDSLNTAYKIAQHQQNTQWLAKSTNDLGLILYKQKKYSKALEFYKNSLSYKEQLGNFYYIGTTLNNLGLLNKDIGDLTQATYYYEQALDNFFKYTQEDAFNIRVFSNISHLYEDLAVIYSQSNNDNKSEYYIRKIIDTFSQKSSKHERLRAFKNLAMLHIDNNQANSAELFLLQAINNIDEQALYSDEISYAQARVSFLRSDLSQSKSYAKKALRLAKTTNNLKILSAIHKLLFDIFRLENNQALALEHIESYYRYRERELSTKYQTDIGLIKEKIEKERFSRQLTEQKLANQEQKNEIRSLTNLILSSLVLLIIISSAIIFIAYRKRKERQSLLTTIQSHKDKLFLLESSTLNNGSENNNEREAVSHSTTISEEQFRTALVTLMIDATSLWEKSTQTNTIELAEKSKIWKVSIDSGRLRTRSLDKYLNIQKLPKNPRWRNVVKTAHYILSECELSKEERNVFNEKLDTLMTVIKQKSLITNPEPS